MIKLVWNKNRNIVPEENPIIIFQKIRLVDKKQRSGPLIKRLHQGAATVYERLQQPNENRQNVIPKKVTKRAVRTSSIKHDQSNIEGRKDINIGEEIINSIRSKLWPEKYLQEGQE